MKTERVFIDKNVETMHEHLNAFKLINMNGRMYDPIVARFLSPDPFVQMPEYSQNFNRYSYVLNNPLRFTDPSGFIFLENFDWFINNQTGNVYYNSEYREGDESKIEGEGWVWFGEDGIFSKDSRFNDYQIILKNSDLLPEIYEKKEYDKSLVFDDAKLVSFNVEATFKGQKALIFMKRQGYDFVKEIYKFHKDVTTDYLPDLVQVTTPHNNSRIESILSYQYVYKDLVFKESKILSEYKHTKNGKAELIGWSPAFSIRNQSWTVRQDIYGKSSLGNFDEKYLLPLEKILPWKNWYKDFWKFIYKK